LVDCVRVLARRESNVTLPALPTTGASVLDACLSLLRALQNTQGILLVPSIGITYPCTFTPVPPSFPPQPLSANPAKTPPLRTANNPILLPTSAASWPGVCVHPCSFAAHSGSRAVSRIGYPLCARHPRRYLRTRRPRRVHGRTERRRLICDGPPYGSMHSGQGDIV